jgi:hypothetical protein
MSRCRIWIWGLGLALVAGPAALSAQAVRGRVVDARDGSPMAGVVVHLLDGSGAIVGRAMSDDRGQFRVVAPVPGAHRLRTLRIGFRPATSDPLQLVAGTDVTPRIALTPVPLELEAVTVAARSVCRAYADAGVAAELWDQARTAFTAARLSASQRLINVTMTTYQRDLDPVNETVLSQSIEAQSGFTARPFVSLPADSLRRSGYVVRAPGGWTVYYAPDLDVLVSDVFLEDHCLRVAGEHDGKIGIAFEPTRDRSRLVEVSGVVWLDRRSLELRRMEFTYTNLSRMHREARSGGYMDFLRVGNLWAISDWHIRMPVIERHARFGDNPEERLARLRLSGGELTLVRRGSDTLWARPAVVLRARVVDSATAAPVANAEVQVRGTALRGTSDSSGSLTIPGLLPGVYTVQLVSPSMGTIGMTFDARVAVAQGDSVHVFRLPGVDLSLDRMCPSLARHDGVIVGTVRARGDSAPPAGLQVFARWELISLHETPSGVITTRMPRFRETVTDTRGRYTLCAVPSLTALEIRTAWNAGPGSPGASVRLDGSARVVRLNLDVDAPSARLRGTVSHARTGQPLEEVEVVLPLAELDTRTDARGQFALDNVPPGAHDVVFRKLGFVPVSVRRDLAASAEHMENVTLAPARVLDSVVVTAKRSAIPGYDTRRMHRQGHAITREELARQEHRRMSEILSLVPGLRVLGAGSGAAWASMGRGSNSLRTDRSPDRISALRGARPACYSDVYMDGALIYGGASGSALPPPLVDLNTYLASTLEAIEYFAGPAQVPPEFNKTGSSCGVLLLWSRRPGG